MGLFADGASDLTPKRGRGNAPSNIRGDGPWAARILLATSTNGLEFVRLHYIISDQADAPNVIVDREGRARIYYSDFGNGNVLACAIQERAGSLTNWIYRRVHVLGRPEDYPNHPVHHSVVTLSDGRYRFYFASAAMASSIYSAISSNGVEFVKEDGVRFNAGREDLSGLTLLRTPKSWWLWCGGEGCFSTRSADGLNFTGAEEFRVEGARFMPRSAVTLPNDGGYRLYGNFVGAGEWSGGISSVTSRDGENWQREAGIRLSLDGSRYSLESHLTPGNGCALLPDGRWLMAYVAAIPRPRGR